MGNDHWKNQPRVPAGNSNGGQFLSPNSYRQNTPYSEIRRNQNADYIVYLEDRKPTVIDPSELLNTSKEYQHSTSNRDISSQMVTIPLSFFEDLSKQSIVQLKKGIRSKRRIIERHEWKIANPSSVYPDWDTFDDARKAREIGHWKREIETHKREISDREAMIKRRNTE